MAQAIRARIHRVPRREQEVHVITNPSDQQTRLLDQSSRSSQRKRLADPDYEAPMTSYRLGHESRWLIVRRNLHRIRFMGYNDRGRDSALPDLYIGFQMKRELKRAQEEIKNIDKEKNFRVIKQFRLAVDNKRTKIYDTSHVKPDDALIYDRLGEEPLALQNLLYYFSKQDVPHGTLFWEFLNEVNRVIHMDTKRKVLVQRLKKLAFTLAIILYSIVGFMLIMMIISAIATVTKMNDPEVQWMEPTADQFSRNLIPL